MEIKINVEAPGLVQAIENLAAALGQTPINPLPTLAEVKEATAKEESNVAKKIMYFQHEGSDGLIVVQKGESLDFLSTDNFDELTKAEYLAKKKELEALEEREEEDSKDETPEITLVTVRSYLQKLQDKGLQAKAKAILTDLGHRKLSDVPAEDYQTIIDKVEELSA